MDNTACGQTWSAPPTISFFTFCALKVPACCSTFSLSFFSLSLKAVKDFNRKIPCPKKKAEFFVFAAWLGQQCVWWMAVELPELQLLLLRFVDLHVWTEEPRERRANEPRNEEQEPRNELLKWQFKWLSSWSEVPEKENSVCQMPQDKSSKANTRNTQNPNNTTPNAKYSNNKRSSQLTSRWTAIKGIRG